MIGTDIIEVERVREAIETHGKHFLDRMFTTTEQKECGQNLARFAGRFAAKEAIAKALGTGFGKDLSWLDIEIHNEENGKPVATLSQEAQKRFSNPVVNLSISHCKDYATAVALIL